MSEKRAPCQYDFRKICPNACPLIADTREFSESFELPSGVSFYEAWNTIVKRFGLEIQAEVRSIENMMDLGILEECVVYQSDQSRNSTEQG